MGNHFHCKLCCCSVREVSKHPKLLERNKTEPFYCGKCNAFMSYEGVRLFSEDD